MRKKAYTDQLLSAEAFGASADFELSAIFNKDFSWTLICICVYYSCHEINGFCDHYLTKFKVLIICLAWYNFDVEMEGYTYLQTHWFYTNCLRSSPF